MSGQVKLEELHKLLNKYYDENESDDFNQIEYDIMNGYMGWLVNTAEKFYPKDDLNLDEQLVESNAYIERQKEYIKQLEEDNKELKDNLSMARMALTFNTDPTI